MRNMIMSVEGQWHKEQYLIKEQTLVSQLWLNILNYYNIPFTFLGGIFTAYV